MNLDGYITIDDILSEVHVSPRTIRYWVQRGLLPKPIRVSNGYKKGVTGLYPPEALLYAKISAAVRNYKISERIVIIQQSDKKDILIRDGVITLRYKGRNNG